MMMNNTLAQLRDLKLAGMVCAIEEQLSGSASTALSFEERLALMVDREVHLRGDKRRAALLKKAQLKYPQAAIEDVDGRTGRGFERSTLMSLALGPEGAPAWPLALGRRWLGHSDHRRHGLGQVVAGVRVGAVRVPARAVSAISARTAPGQGLARPARQRRLHALARGGRAHRRAAAG